MKLETVYLGHDNSIDVLLKADGVAQDLSGVTKMTLTFGTKKVESTNQTNDPILWNKGGYQTGEVRFFLGGVSITPKTYHAPLIVYDVDNDDGIVWGYFDVVVVAEVEAATT